MNSESVLELLSGKLSNIQIGEEGTILRGEYVFNDLKVGVFYIDFSDNTLNSDLDNYLENFISTDYYNNPGYLQWNFYLIFLRDQQIDKSIKNTIEKNDTYARKFVFTSQDLKSYFEYTESDQEVDIDIISLWKEKLSSVDLNEVYDSTMYTEAIPRFITGAVLKESSEISPSQTNESFSIQKLTTINFTDEYRRYPTQRSFTFGTANLIRGVNGSGKTSLLEGIELIVTGKNYKDYSFAEPDSCISAIYNDSDEYSDFYTPTDNTKYRNRDILWYASSYKAGNELYRAFNKYNFYDSDAAYHLSYNSDIRSLTQYLSSIALGSEFIRIQDRMKGFNERLSKEMRDRNRIYQQEEASLKRAQETKAGIQSSTNPGSDFNSFLQFSKSINWQGILPSSIDDNNKQFESDYISVKSDFSSLNQLIDTIQIITLKNWAEAIEKTTQLIAEYKTSEGLISELKNAIAERSALSKDDSFKLQFLIQAEKYFQNEDSFQLTGLDNKIVSLTGNVSKLDRYLKLFDEIQGSVVFLSEEEYAAYKAKALGEIQKLKAEERQLKEQRDKLLASLSKLDEIITEIKTLGNQFLESNPESNSCPLCDTTYSFEELKSRIQKISKNIAGNEAITILDGQLLTAGKKIESSEHLIRDIEAIEGSISIIKPLSQYASIKLFEIKREFTENKSLLSKQRAELQRLLQLKTSLQDMDLSESQFGIVKNNLETHFSDLQFNFQAKALFEEKLRTIKKNVDSSAGVNLQDEQKITDLEKQFVEKTKDFVTIDNFASAERQLKFRKDLLDSGVGHFNSIKMIINFKEIDNINDVFQKVNRLNAEYEKYKKSFSEEKEMVLANQIIKESQNKIKVLQPEIHRINKALEVLSDLLTNYSETKILAAFIENNENQIQEIFQNIHSPKEFSKIIFNYGSNSVLLKRKSTSQEVSLNKISTGQRSALSLSIFLALNKKLKRGPNLILFDDPVSYTDDLNILSFLDYLREIVINENRQIIFATANAKLASLFEKKFGFLNDDFKKFHLEREIL